MKHKELFENEVAIIRKITSATGGGGGGNNNNDEHATKNKKKKSLVFDASSRTSHHSFFHSYDGDDDTNALDPIRFREDAIRKHYVDYPYCLVMEAAKAANLEMFFMVQ